MKLNKKVTDFIRLEEGNIGRKAAVVTGALLTSGVLSTVLTTQVAQAGDCPPAYYHDEYYPHYNVAHQDVPAHSDYYHIHDCFNTP